MGDPLRSPLSFGLRIQAHSQAKSLPTCVQRTKDNISNIAFKIFKNPANFIGAMRMRTYPDRRMPPPQLTLSL